MPSSDDLSFAVSGRVLMSGYQRTLLTKGYTRSYFLQGQTDDANGPGLYDPEDFILIYPTIMNTNVPGPSGDDGDTQVYIPQPGYPDQTDPDSICTTATLNPYNGESANQLQLICTFEGTTRQCVWTESEQLVQELWNYDNDGDLTSVQYSPPAGAVAPGNNNYDQPHVANLPRFITLVTRRCVFFTTDPVFISNMNTDSSGSVNQTPWGASAASQIGTTTIGNDPARTWLLSRAESLCPGNNGLWMCVIEVIRRDRTWDELAVYLSPDNTLLAGTSSIPSPDNYANDPSLFDQTGPPWKPNGIKRFKMNQEEDFNNLFQYMSRVAPPWFQNGIAGGGGL